MRTSIVQSLLAWLCLISVGLSGTALRAGFVICSDGHGGSRLEWGCAQTDSGECTTSCDECHDQAPASDSHDLHVPTNQDPTHPCDDRPLVSEHVGAQRESRLLEVPVLAVAAALELPALACTAPCVEGLPRHVPPDASPPDTVERLRSVILVV
ncbi:MAG: hypothetical protein U0575_06310 [Phycisphaerales bacterium]